MVRLFGWLALLARSDDAGSDAGSDAGAPETAFIGCADVWPGSWKPRHAPISSPSPPRGQATMAQRRSIPSSGMALHTRKPTAGLHNGGDRDHRKPRLPVNAR